MTTDSRFMASITEEYLNVGRCRSCVRANLLFQRTALYALHVTFPSVLKGNQKYVKQKCLQDLYFIFDNTKRFCGITFSH